MERKCPNINCISHTTGSKIVRDGSFFRPSDGRRVQRFRCRCCKKRFSRATFEDSYRQNKRRVNNPLKKLWSSGISIRRAAIILNVNKNTVAKKLDFLGLISQRENLAYLSRQKRSKNVQFDDLQTIEHTKCKPLSVTMAVDEESRKILGFEVSKMPATGHLARIARKKYGRRVDERQKGIERLFEKISDLIEPNALFTSDEHPYYAPKIKKYFPNAKHTQFKGAKSSVAGQGELKKIKHDPLFSINHTFAMLRANINRLIRKTWCTTKDPARLVHHLNIYMHFHNTVLTS